MTFVRVPCFLDSGRASFRLPDELYTEVFQHLTDRELRTVAKTCRFFYFYLRNDFLRFLVAKARQQPSRATHLLEEFKRFPPLLRTPRWWKSMEQIATFVLKTEILVPRERTERARQCLLAELRFCVFSGVIDQRSISPSKETRALLNELNKGISQIERGYWFGKAIDSSLTEIANLLFIPGETFVLASKEDLSI